MPAPKIINLAATLLLIGMGSAPVYADMTHDATVFERLNPHHTPIPASLFNLSLKGYDPAAAWPTLDFYGLRTLKSAWKLIEPEKGHWDFQLLDRQVEWAQVHNKEILLVLGTSPVWASARPTEPGCCKTAPTPGARAEANNMADWRNYILAVASRYKGKVHYYALWTDPSKPRFYSGSLQALLDMNRVAYRTIKSVDLGAQVVSPDISDPVYFEKYLAGGGGDAADIIGFHFRIPPRAPESMLPMVSIIRSLMIKYGISQKLLWDTEAGGVHADRMLDGSSALNMEDVYQAWVARAYILSWAAGVSRLYWSSGPKAPAALVTGGKSSHGGELPVRSTRQVDGAGRGNRPVDAVARHFPAAPVARPAGPVETAYATLQGWLVGGRMHACSMDFDKTWACTLTRKNSHPAFIVWNSMHRSTFALPQGWNAFQRADLNGHSQMVHGTNQVGVDRAPVLIEKLTPSVE